MPDTVAKSSDSPMISPTELHSLLRDNSQSLVLLDCRFSLTDPNAGENHFRQSHIPSAQYCHLERDLSAPVAANKNGGRHPIPSKDSLAELFSAFGICSPAESVDDEQTLVVVYDDSRFAFASRCWWLLGFVGHQRVKILDGGFSAWLNEKLPTSSEYISPTSALFAVKPAISQLFSAVEYEVVSAISTGSRTGRLIDSREKQRYLGEQEPIDPVAGHIPLARCFPWQEISTDEGTIQELGFHTERWREIGSGKNELVVYCGSGVTACVNLLSMWIAGVDRVQLYAGSWSDWCSRDLPVALGDE